jgi:hypothetical protein
MQYALKKRLYSWMKRFKVFTHHQICIIRLTQRMRTLYCSILIYLFFMLSAMPAWSQSDYQLIDSLITKRLFPILPSDSNDTLDVHYKSKTEVYSYDLSNEKPAILSYRVGDGSYRFTHPSFNKAFTKSDTTLIPNVHVAFYYPFTSLYGTSMYPTFTIDQFFKNFGDSTWRMSDHHFNLTIKRSEADTVLFRYFKGSDLSKNRQGYEFSSIHNIGTLKDESVLLWNAITPYVYSYVIEILNREQKPYEFFYGKVGFRQIQLLKNTIRVNRSEVNLRAVRLEIGLSEDHDEIIQKLRQLKVNNVNTIVLSLRAPTYVLDWCDVNGLYVVQEMTDSTFENLQELLQYFVDTRDHPSLIFWNDTGASRDIVKILKRLERYRPMTNNFNTYQYFVNDWFSLNREDQEKLKRQFQLYDFYYIPATNQLSINRKEGFRFENHLSVEWTISDSLNIISSGSLPLPEFHQNKLEVKISGDMISYIDCEHSYDFKIVINTDCYPYHKGDVIGLSKFSYRYKDGVLVYTRDY